MCIHIIIHTLNVKLEKLFETKISKYEESQNDKYNLKSIPFSPKFKVN